MADQTPQIKKTDCKCEVGGSYTMYVLRITYRYTYTLDETSSGPRAGSKVSSEMLNYYGGWEMKCFLVVSRHVTDVSHFTMFRMESTILRKGHNNSTIHCMKPHLWLSHFLEQRRSFANATQALKKRLSKIGTENHPQYVPHSRYLQSRFQVDATCWNAWAWSWFWF